MIKYQRIGSRKSDTFIISSDDSDSFLSYFSLPLKVVNDSSISSLEYFYIFPVNVMIFSCFVIHGASGFLSIASIEKLHRSWSSNVGNISGGSTFGNGTHGFTKTFFLPPGMDKSINGRKFDSLFLFGKTYT